MFMKLDTDRSGLLDMEEITHLFHKNGIFMKKEQVAELFASAKQAQLLEQHRK